MTPQQRRKIWPQLAAEGKKALRRDFGALLADDMHPGTRLKAGPLALYFSRENVTEKGLSIFLRFAEDSGFTVAREAMFSGETVNTSERRAALHTALRDFENPNPEISAERARAFAFAEKLRAGQVKGATGKTIRHIIHVGIGGSDLGPRLLVQALADGKGPQVHFIANADAAPLQRLSATLNAEETLVFIVSKTFTTAEVQLNAAALFGWLQRVLGDTAKTHLVAITAATGIAKAFGVSPENIYALWDWVGGRFSVCSSVSLSAMAAMGAERFEEFLHGAEAMDRHFKSTPLPQNLPVMLALLGVWNVNALGYTARAVVPYAEDLNLWPAYVQQLEMESLGKNMDRNGAKVNYATAPVVFGASGTPAQHAFMQALHQGTQIIPAEILVVKDSGAAQEHQQFLQASAVAQSEALARGQASTNEGDNILAAQKSFDGNRPSSILVLDDVFPATLGALVALYEHKVFVQGHLWNINPFDQWGVELGKQLAKPYQAFLAGKAVETPVPSILREIKRK